MKWQERFMKLATDISAWSKDPSTKVGAVITDDCNRVLGLGFNGFARDVVDRQDRLQDRDVKYPLTIHAELNAIFNANKSVRGGILYCTHLPCAHCASCIIQAGIARVVAPQPTEDYLSRWGEQVQLALTILQEAGVEVVYG